MAAAVAIDPTELDLATYPAKIMVPYNSNQISRSALPLKTKVARARGACRQN